jgi:hypothetical protein
MEKGRRLISSAEISPTKENAYVGDRISVLCSQNCGYIELNEENEG